MMTNKAPETSGEKDQPGSVSMSELEDAIQHQEELRQTGIRHPELRNRARSSVEQLVRQAARIKKYLDGEAWDDTKDLI